MPSVEIPTFANLPDRHFEGWAMIEIGIAHCFDIVGESARGRWRRSWNGLGKRLADKTGLRCRRDRRTDEWHFQHLAA
ncbi:hypothetical protein NKI56_07155 [Mesorhizobium sp. M0622]|uniref:hypothetical protein n=1 Tax=unclassified Mesorhizobium TaxID=325217 RepID=UPI003338052B